MIKKCILLAIALATILSLTACGGSSGTSSPISGSETAKPSPTPAVSGTPTPENTRNELNLSVGEKLSYAFFENDVDFGLNEYEVTNAQETQDGILYTITSALRLKSSSSCQPTTASGTLEVTQAAFPVSYQEYSSIGSG